MAETTELIKGNKIMVHDGITESVYDVLTVEASVASRTSYGGTAPVRVREQIARWKQQLA